jgi:chorismate mutase-like protein
MTAKTVTMPVIVASGLAMLGAPDAGADVTSPLQALVDAAARRLQTADPVAASKFRTGGQVDDPQREQQVIDAVTADAALAHIDAGYVHNVFRNQIDATDSLGFWKALREVFPDTREQWCWFHVSSNVFAALPKSAHPGAKAALAQIHNAEDRDHALNAVKAFEADYGAKWPKAVAKITEHTEVLLAFYDYPAQHWIQLRTTNPIESTFATVRLRQRVTKGPGSRTAGIAMAYKLIEAAQSRWRAVNAPHLVALVRAGAKFENGKLIERPDETTTKEAAA